MQSICVYANVLYLRNKIRDVSHTGRHGKSQELSSEHYCSSDHLLAVARASFLFTLLHIVGFDSCNSAAFARNSLRAYQPGRWPPRAQDTTHQLLVVTGVCKHAVVMLRTFQHVHTAMRVKCSASTQGTGGEGGGAHHKLAT